MPSRACGPTVFKSRGRECLAALVSRLAATLLLVDGDVGEMGVDHVMSPGHRSGIGASDTVRLRAPSRIRRPTSDVPLPPQSRAEDPVRAIDLDRDSTRHEPRRQANTNSQRGGPL